jgi:hypothetical protein
MQLLGLPESHVVKLAKLGYLDVVRGPHIDGCQRWKVSQQSVSDYRQRIIRRLLVPPSPSTASFDLARAIDLLIYVGLDTIEIFERVAAGKLPAYHPQPDEADLADLRFAETDIRTCVEVVKAENGWVTRLEIAQRMGLSRKESISDWIEVGLLSPVAVHTQIQYFDRNAVEAFVNDHLLIHQASEILQMHPSRIYGWVAEGQLHPVSGAGIDGCFRLLLRRSEVERLQKLMTTSQMAQHLGLNCMQVIHQVRKGLLHPISGPGIDDSPHYFFERPPEFAL